MDAVKSLRGRDFPTLIQKRTRFSPYTSSSVLLFFTDVRMSNSEVWGAFVSLPPIFLGVFAFATQCGAISAERKSSRIPYQIGIASNANSPIVFVSYVQVQRAVALLCTSQCSRGILLRRQRGHSTQTYPLSDATCRFPLWLITSDDPCLSQPGTHAGCS